jgi:CRISPR-associated protein Csb2
VGKHLCLSVTLLDDRFHGKADGDESEWPPSPWRLFQALLAGVAASGSDAEVLRWLEGRMPTIVAPSVKNLCSYRLSVPNNDMDTLARGWAAGREPDKSVAELRTMKTVRPVGLVADYPNQTLTVHYVYFLSDDDESHAKAICAIAGRLHTLGWGVDAACAIGRLVQDDQVAELPGVRWLPRPDIHHAGQSRRVADLGALEDLRRCHELFTSRVSKKLYTFPNRSHRFRVVPYGPSSAVAARPYVAFELRRVENPDEYRALRQEDANVVAAMVRHVACDAAKVEWPFAEASDVYVAGHANGSSETPPRFSYLPLPTIGHPHADGMIRRVFVTEPHGGDGRHVEWLRLQLRGGILVQEDRGRPVALLQRTRRADSVVARYLGPTREWSSVTPVILPGYDEFKGIRDHRDLQPTKAERLLLKCLLHAGIPPEAVSDLTMRKAPFWPGSLHPRQYRRPQYLADHHARPGWHVHLLFREPVTGPLAVGAGRHCGLGLMAGIDP